MKVKRTTSETNAEELVNHFGPLSAAVFASYISCEAVTGDKDPVVQEAFDKFASLIEIAVREAIAAEQNEGVA